MGFNVEFHVSVHGDIKISGGVFEWKNKKSMEVQPAVEYVFGSLGVYWIKKKKIEMKWVCGNMATMRSLCSGWLQNHVFLSVWMEKQKTEKLMEVQLPMEFRKCVILCKSNYFFFFSQFNNLITLGHTYEFFSILIHVEFFFPLESLVVNLKNPC